MPGRTLISVYHTPNMSSSSSKQPQHEIISPASRPISTPFNDPIPPEPMPPRFASHHGKFDESMNILQNSQQQKGVEQTITSQIESVKQSLIETSVSPSLISSNSTKNNNSFVSITIPIISSISLATSSTFILPKEAEEEEAISIPPAVEHIEIDESEAMNIDTINIEAINIDTIPIHQQNDEETRQPVVDDTNTVNEEELKDFVNENLMIEDAAKSPYVPGSYIILLFLL